MGQAPQRRRPVGLPASLRMRSSRPEARRAAVVIRRKHSWILVTGAFLVFGCGGETGTNPQPHPDPVDSTVCLGPVDLSVSSGTTPTFSWSPDCKIGRLIVMDGLLETWGTETLGENIYEAPIVYDVPPPGAVEPEPAVPLVEGRTYTVSVYRWFSVSPVESLVFLGEQDFTP